MSKKDKALAVLLQQKLLPLFYHEDEKLSRDILQALYDGGIRILEYTNRGENALENFKVLRKAADKHMPGLLLGIGTIKSKKQAKKFIEAGADFIVCPSTDKEVAAITHKAGLLWIPGCMTPTEIAMAENAGAKLIKVFPGNMLGPGFVLSVKDLFPGLMFMPTGGVEAEETNLQKWFNAGVVAVGMGSKLVSSSIVDQKDFASLSLAASHALKLVQSVRKI